MSEDFHEVRVKNQKDFERFCEDVGADYEQTETPNMEGTDQFLIAHTCKLKKPMEFSVSVNEGNLLQVVARDLKNPRDISTFYVRREKAPEGDERFSQFNMLSFIDKTGKATEATASIINKEVSAKIKTVGNEISIHNIIPQFMQAEIEAGSENVPATDQFIYVKKIKPNQTKESEIEM